MSPQLKPGVYLDDNTPRQRQFRERRGSKPMQAVVVVHTAENNPDLHGVDNGAENVADFIRTRTSYGSYHVVGDRDTIIRLQTNNLTVYHDTSSNNWSTSLSGAMQGVNWSSLTGTLREQWIESFVTMMVIQGQDLQRRGVGLPAARLLSRSQAHATGASGFIGHGHMDPSRRSDPGRDFPWTEILKRYAEAVKTEYRPSIGSLRQGSTGSLVETLQQNINRLFPSANLVVDGDFGPATDKAVRKLQATLGVDPDGIVGPNTRDAIDSALKDLDLPQDEPSVASDKVKHIQRLVNSFYDRESIDAEIPVDGLVSPGLKRAVLDLRALLNAKSNQYEREARILRQHQDTVGHPE